MFGRQQNAKVYVRKFGRPDFFITVTTHPKWPEILYTVPRPERSRASQYLLYVRSQSNQLLLYVDNKLCTKVTKFNITLSHFCASKETC